MKHYVRLLIAGMLIIGVTGCQKEAPVEEKEAAVNQTPVVEKEAPENEEEAPEATEEDAVTSASVDGTTSASIVPEALVASYEPKGFTEGDAKKALFVIADPRGYSVNYDLANTAMAYFEENGIEVEKRDLYAMGFNPVLEMENFYYAKDGTGEPSDAVKVEQDFVTKADYIIFCYPNWHDTPTAMAKGYMETVFAKKFAYQDTENGLEGMLSDKGIFTIMNAGFLGGGRGYIGDGVGIDDAAWDAYMNAFKVFDDDTAGFWGTDNLGRFVNDRTPKNNDENYEETLNVLRDDLRAHLKNVFIDN